MLNAKHSVKIKKNQGQSKITIRAKGTGVTISPPEMELWLNGEKQMGWTILNEDEYKEYTWYGYWDKENLIDIVYANDYGTETALRIDWVEVNGVKKQAEESNVFYDQGTYSNGCFDGVDKIPGREQMDVTGALRFAFAGIIGSLNRTIAYDHENRITLITDNGTTAEFDYDAMGRRVKKSVNGVTTTYYFFANYEEVVSGGEVREIKYYFGPNGRIAQRTTISGDDELLYIHTDHLGSAVRMTDVNGFIMQSIVYDPFGKTLYMGGEKDLPYQFTAREFDGDTGLYYYGARYYDPELGRLVQPDTVLDGLNRYTYCGNNPVMYVDPTGNDSTPIDLAQASSQVNYTYSVNQSTSTEIRADGTSTVTTTTTTVGTIQNSDGSITTTTTITSTTTTYDKTYRGTRKKETMVNVLPKSKWRCMWMGSGLTLRRFSGGIALASC